MDERLSDDPRHLERGGKAADRHPRRKVRWLPRAMLHLSLPASPSFAYVSEGQTARNEGADETRDRGSTTDFLQPMTAHVPARRDVHQPRHCCDQDVGMRLRLSSRSPAHQCHSGLLPTATSLFLFSFLPFYTHPSWARPAWECDFVLLFALRFSPAAF